MISLFKNTPSVKDKSTAVRYMILAIAFICTIFIISPVMVFLVKKENPLTEMPNSGIYFLFRAFFGISLLISGLVYLVYKKLSATFIPAIMGLIASVFPLIYRIDRYKEYKDIIERSSMTADYAPYLANIGLYILLMLLCITYIIYIFGIYRFNIAVLVFSALSATAVLFLTIDKAKTIEFNIFSIYDILCFSYGILVCLLPTFIVFTSEKAANKTEDSDVAVQDKCKRYKPRRMK